jgi:hypothetical protein
MLRPLPPALALATLLAAAAAGAQPAPAAPAPPDVMPPTSPTPAAPVAPPAPAAPPAGADAPPGFPQQPIAPVGPGYPPPGYAPPGSPQALPPGYGPPPGYGYGYAPPPPVPPPPPPLKSLKWSLRYDPFDLVYRRMTFQGEVAIYKFFALEVVPTWIFGSSEGGVDAKGFAIGGRAVFYLSGEAFRGFWLKAHFGYENYNATLTNPGDPTDVSAPQKESSAIIGVLFGDTWVIPRDGGFALSGGIGIGYATAGKSVLTTNGSAVAGPAQVTFYDGFDKVRLLGSVGLGVAF